MSNKEKYEGKTVQIYAPFGGRALHKIECDEVKNENVLCGIIVGTDVYTAYYLSDGIRAEVVS